MGTPMTQNACHGNGEDHCCYVDGQVCSFLEVDTMPGRHWVCSLRRTLGSWTAVHADPGYIAKVASVWLRTGTPPCGLWKIKGQCCFGRYQPVFNV